MHFILKCFSVNENVLQFFIFSNVLARRQDKEDQRFRFVMQHLSLYTLMKALYIMTNLCISLNLFLSFAVLST